MREHIIRRRLPRSHTRSQRAIVAAVSTIALVQSAQAATNRFFDSNGTGSNLGTGSGTWNATNANWATVSNPGTAAPGVWVPGAIANVNSTTIVVADTESVGGLAFNSG